MHCAIAHRKRSRNTSFLFATENSSTAGESGFVEASSVCLMGQETELTEIFRNDFAQELIHLFLHVIHSASLLARAKTIRNKIDLGPGIFDHAFVAIAVAEVAVTGVEEAVALGAAAGCASFQGTSKFRTSLEIPFTCTGVCSMNEAANSGATAFT